jgi:hypothetical protein
MNVLLIQMPESQSIVDVGVDNSMFGYLIKEGLGTRALARTVM